MSGRFINRLDEGLWIYLNANLERYADTVSGIPRTWGDGIDNGLNGIGVVDKLLTDGVLWNGFI